MNGNLNNYTVFVKPGRSGMFSRVIWNWFIKLFHRITGSDDRSALRRILTLAAGFMILLAGLIAANPADFWMVYRDEGYEMPSVIFAQDHEGKPVEIAELYRYNRKVISLKDSGPEGMDSKIVQAFIATEDNKFMSHFGIDPQGILRAAFVNILAGRVKEGASTITQQVVRLRFLSRQRSFVRKAREAFLSLLTELRYSKKEIMELYLNEVPLGHGAFGAEAASQFYFEKSVFDLSWGEAAVLSSLTTRPRDLSPLYDINESRKKVRVVMQKLVESGLLTVSEAEAEYSDLENNFYANLNRSPNDSSFARRLNLYPYATEFVKLRIPSKFRGQLYSGGLRIYTTIRTDHQSAADEVFLNYLKELSVKWKKPPFKNFDEFDKTYGGIYPLLRDLTGIPEFQLKMNRDMRDFRREFLAELRNEAVLLSQVAGEGNIQEALENDLQRPDPTIETEPTVEGSLLSIRPFTGEITAVAGGSGFNSGNQQLRFLTARRQPGSSFKPLVYAAGIESTGQNPDGKKPLTAASLVDDSPVQFVASDLSVYAPTNYEDTYDGFMTLRKALTLSKNSVAVKVYEYLGPTRVNTLVERLLGYDSADNSRKLPREAAVALGTYGVTPMELIRAYAAFASEGKEVHPHVILYITDSKGNILADYRDQYKNKEQKALVSPETARIMTSLMEDVVNSGTGKAAKVPGRTTAGKTGTTNRNTDAWFVGYTPDLVTSVHIAYDTNRSLSGSGTGGGLAAPVWGQYMSRALRKEPVRNFNYDSAKVNFRKVCRHSGKLPGKDCSEFTDEIFIPGTEPKEICEDHGSSHDHILMSVPQIKKGDKIFSESDF